MYRYRGLLGFLLLVLAACGDRRSEIVPATREIEDRMLHSAYVLYDESDSTLKAYAQATGMTPFGPSISLTPPSKYLFNGKEMSTLKEGSARLFFPGAAYEFEEKGKALEKGLTLTWVRLDKTQHEFRIPAPSQVALTVPEARQFRVGDRIGVRWQGTPLVENSSVTLSISVRSRTNVARSFHSPLNEERDTEFDLCDHLGALPPAEAPFQIRVHLMRRQLTGSQNFRAVSVYSTVATTFTLNPR